MKSRKPSEFELSKFCIGKLPRKKKEIFFNNIIIPYSGTLQLTERQNAIKEYNSLALDRQMAHRPKQHRFVLIS
jgi:hypothetical protein